MTHRKVIFFESIRIACKNCSLASACLPGGLAPEDVEQLEALVERSRPFHRGDVLFRHGEPLRALYVVKTGSVKTCAPGMNAEEQVLGFYLPGEPIGLGGIAQHCHSRTARVLETSAICEIPYLPLTQLATTLPALQRQLYHLLSRELNQQSEMLLLLGRKHAAERLATFLTDLSQRFGRRGLSATEFTLSMSRHDISNYLGLAVETISRLFSRFQADGLLQVDRKQIKILNSVALKRLSGAPVTPPPRRHRSHQQS
ncbi:fumarate/nitrate reduction transcriptional regulator Fnr [Thiospirillum jenense]|uniref:Fumarate/nitrate reduction transcriptional regulator Fnr n=1 Tax=Thiospirillum jenense TaxID=1653858 RepID=A0A839H533_9GAMM|nr:fumarate/nitrate reduction transcriptional regulator Fnr [Thiospirillum jenense]